MKWFVGTSGWAYGPWKDRFYPADLPSNQWLVYYAKHFDAVEVNYSFYHLPGVEKVHKWEEMVPDDFTFAFKGSRFITHTHRLKNPEETVGRFMKVMVERKKKGPLIFQLPPHFPKDLERLEEFLVVLPKRQRCAVEFRDPDWHADEVYAVLQKHNVAFCLFEKGKLRSPRLVTADFSYVRLHGRQENYKGNYSARELHDWHDWLVAQNVDVYVFFDNTNSGDKLYALDNARDLKNMS